jgi:hypothetical protein
MPPPSRKTPFLPGIITLVFFAIAVPVGIIVVFAIWLAGAAAFENVKFARCTEQVLSIIAAVQEDAGKDLTFGQVLREDIIDDLIRRGQLPGIPRNAWGGTVKATIQPLPFMRLELELPSYACQRLAIYMGKNASDLKLQKVEAGEGNNKWSTFFDAATNLDESEFSGANQGCGTGVQSTLVLTLRLR